MNEVKRNCNNCGYLGYDDDGGDVEWARGFLVCKLTYLTDEDIEDNTDKEGFPFEDEQFCHVPDFWLYLDVDSELKDIHSQDMRVYDESDEIIDIMATRAFERYEEKYVNLKPKDWDD